ncbi:DNA cytosine methyltransferase [Silvimonas sp.]|uniref:DNA cytosine methyltransferase n=1 Tax=Silvimonas sp. TaxID=2650811 RepID=UPI00284B8940|nr:DNA cytosine methyltransferase [Silvimonas sp.]MDR3427369.1 DNA cytosine methyltransferase [Silvimonas sp.]
MQQPRFISLFAGCGGLDLGFIEAGFEPLAAYDIWPLAIENYKKNIGDHGAVYDLSTGMLPADIVCDVVLAGSPCQGFSTAGKRQFDDPRNNLLHAAAAIAIKARPKVIVFENVLGVIQGKHRIHWDTVCNSIRSAGYQTTTLVVDARETGLPQLRKRVVLIAWNTGASFRPELDICTMPSLAEVIHGAESCENHEPRLLAKDSNEYRVASHIRSGQKLCNVRGGSASVHTWNIPEVFGFVSDPEIEILRSLMGLRRRRRVRDFGDADPVPLDVLQAELKRCVAADVKSLLQKNYLRDLGGVLDLKHTFNGKYRRPCPNGVSHTVDSRFGDPTCFLHPDEPRGFSVREAARIQGFPDRYIFHGPQSDQFKMVANAVPPAMGLSIGKMIRRGLCL